MEKAGRNFLAPACHLRFRSLSEAFVVGFIAEALRASVLAAGHRVQDHRGLLVRRVHPVRRAHPGLDQVRRSARASHRICIMACSFACCSAVILLFDGDGLPEMQTL